jgi:two-component system alkaline phosphatase synthesis response regulator PhoP/two-component system response regulator ResD
VSRHLLIVDDEAAIRFAVTEYFVAYGDSMDSAHDVESAQAHLLGTRYDAVIADLRLGGADESGGLDVIDIASRQHYQPCIVLLSAEHTPEVVREALRRGAHFTLHKPVPLSELKGRINDYLSWRARVGPHETFEPQAFLPGAPAPDAT